MRTHTALASVFIAGILLLTGCMNYMPRLVNPLSTAASMRVEVEVYKGPLSKNISVQWGELDGLVEEAADALTTFNDAIVTAASKSGYVTRRNEYAELSKDFLLPFCSSTDMDKDAKVSIDTHYRSKKIAEQSAGKILPRTKRPKIDTRTVEKVGGSFIHNNDPPEKGETIKWCASKEVQEDKQWLIGCHILSNMHDDIRVLLEELDGLHGIMYPYLCDGSASCKQRKRLMQQVGRVATKLKAKAMYWAETHVGIAPQCRGVRVAIAAFANLASEYSNQLESLADGLQWQLGEKDDGIDAKQLPLSVYLRNAETTDFLNLYTWNRAALPAIWEEMFLHPFNAFTSEETADRIRVIERLFADHNWEKINTVYGSGDGDFSMALIKDEIGNWNLKSFDSDPTELLKAYTNFALTSISSKGSSLFTQIGGAAGPSNVLNTNTLHKRVVEKLKAIQSAEQKNASISQQILAVLDEYEVVIGSLQAALTESLTTSRVQTNNKSE